MVSEMAVRYKLFTFRVTEQISERKRWEVLCTRLSEMYLHGVTFYGEATEAMCYSLDSPFE